MPSPEAVQAAVRVLTTVVTGGEAEGDADLFAQTITAAAHELPNGFEDLVSGLLLISQLLVDMTAHGNVITPQQVIALVGQQVARQYDT